MVQLIGGTTIALRMDDSNIGKLFNGNVNSTSESSFRVSFDEGYTIFKGNSFAFNTSGEPTAGTITDISATLDGATAFSITGLAANAALFNSFDPANSAETLQALFSGNDDLQGTRFNDVLSGYSGHDNLFGGDGADTLAGGSGNDHLFGRSPIGGDDGADQLFGDDGSDYLQGNGGADTLNGGNGSDRIVGGEGNDAISGGFGNDSVNGNRGDDYIGGADGNDYLRGGQGNDSILGGDGNDVLLGDLGRDVLTGGADADSFVFGGQYSLIRSGPDRITDYVHGTDHISVGYDPVGILTGQSRPSDEAAAAVAQQLFDDHPGNHEIAALSVGADTYLFYSSDGGPHVDSAVLLEGVNASAVTIADFI